MTYHPSEGKYPVRQSKAVLKQSDSPYVTVCVLTAAYLSLTHPVFMAVVGVLATFALVLSQIAQAIPLIERKVRFKIRFWHVAAAIMTLAALLGLLDVPAHAQFLSGLEDAVTEVAGESIPGDVITLIFSAIRVVFLLLVVAAGIFAYNQAQQGNDWRPIVTQMALGVAVVIAIDVLTELFVGGGGGAA